MVYSVEGVVKWGSNHDIANHFATNLIQSLKIRIVNCLSFYPLFPIFPFHRDLQSVIPNIAEAVCSEVNKCQIERGRPELETDKLEALKAQVLAVGDKQHTLHKLLGKYDHRYI